MVLEELHTLIETLQDRITKHGPALRQSEALTRYVLIDPLLRALGWDTADPAQVVAEYRSASGSADYALLDANGKPLVIVEAKRLDTQLGSAITQVINYCIQDGFEYFAVSDGQRWQLYETNRPGPLAERRVMAFDLKSSPAQACIAALALWRPAATEGHVQVSALPIVSETSVAAPAPAGPPQSLASSHLPSVESPATIPVDGWTPLSQLQVAQGAKPSELRLPSGAIRKTPYWTEVTIEAVTWLVTEGHLTSAHLPISGKFSRHLAAADKVHANGTPFKNVRYIEPVFLELNFNARDQVGNARQIVEHVGQNPADFAVRLAK